MCVRSISVRKRRAAVDKAGSHHRFNVSVGGLSTARRCLSSRERISHIMASLYRPFRWGRNESVIDNRSRRVQHTPAN